MALWDKQPGELFLLGFNGFRAMSDLSDIALCIYPFKIKNKGIRKITSFGIVQEYFGINFMNNTKYILTIHTF